MKRQRIKTEYVELTNQDDGPSDSPRRVEPTMEAEVREGETLASIALRFHCTVSDLKRINKIDKEFEIYARKTVKVPITPHNVLLDTLPTVHKSGNSSPNTVNGLAGPTEKLSDLNEKLLVASVVNSSYANDTYRDFPRGEGDPSITEPLEGEEMPIPTVVLARPHAWDFSCSGSDWDFNWICLLLVILAVCIFIPTIIVLRGEKLHEKHELQHVTTIHHDATHTL